MPLFLDNIPDYKALSYAWGDELSSISTSIDGDSLMSAMPALCTHGTPPPQLTPFVMGGIQDGPVLYKASAP
jgi:hypothetical protein